MKGTGTPRWPQPQLPPHTHFSWGVSHKATEAKHLPQPGGHLPDPRPTPHHCPTLRLKGHLHDASLPLWGHIPWMRGAARVAPRGLKWPGLGTDGR